VSPFRWGTQFNKLFMCSACDFSSNFLLVCYAAMGISSALI
jgi:hypothetical protein